MANVSRYNPVSDMNRLHNEVSRLFEDFFPVSRTRAESSVWAPAIDLYEKEDAYVLSMDLPGLTRDDVEISFENGILQISGERTIKQEDKSSQYHRIERWYGRFYRSIPFDRDVNPGKITARMENGILEVVLMKLEESKPVKVKIS